MMTSKSKIIFLKLQFLTKESVSELKQKSVFDSSTSTNFTSHGYDIVSFSLYEQDLSFLKRHLIL